MTEVNPDVERLHGLEGQENLDLLMHLHRYRIAEAFASSKDVLDFGTGDGYGAHLLAPTAKSVLGVDVHEPSIRAARAKYRHEALRYDVVSIETMEALPSKSYDLITCFEMIEHVDEAGQHALVKGLARLLRSDGLLLMSTPDAEVKERVYARLPSWRNPYHVREITAAELRAQLASQFRYVEIVPQTIEIASVMKLPAPTIPPVLAKQSWVTMGFASNAPLALGRPLPAVCLPQRTDLLEDLIVSDTHGRTTIHRMVPELEQARRDLVRAQNELHDTKLELGLLRSRAQELKQALDLERAPPPSPLRKLRNGLSRLKPANLRGV